MRKILVLDANARTGALATVLKESGFEIEAVETAEALLSSLGRPAPARLVIIACPVPDADGLELCRRLRAGDAETGIILLSENGGEAEKIAVLLGGADDCAVPPFSVPELAARVQALYRRVGSSGGERALSRHPFHLNTRTRILEKNGEKIRLTQIECAIIELFLRNPGLALSREELLTRVWGREYFGELKIVDVNIRRLRIKLEDDPQHPEHITTVWGYGYRWNA